MPTLRRVAQLLLGLGRPERQHGRPCRRAPRRAARPASTRALLVRAGGEPEVGGVDRLPVGGDVDPRARRGHPLDADQDVHEPTSQWTRVDRRSAAERGRDSSGLHAGVVGIEQRAAADARDASPGTARSCTSPAARCPRRRARAAGTPCSRYCPSDGAAPAVVTRDTRPLASTMRSPSSVRIGSLPPVG